MKRASAVNTLTNELQQVLENRLGEIPILRTVIPTSVVLSRFNFVDKLPAEKTIMMSGTLNGYYDKNLTERVMQTFADEGYRTKWCRPRESTSSSLNVRNAEILEVHHEEMPSQIATASIGLAICRDDVGISLKGVMPTKVPEFLAVGRPVIISKGMGDLDQLIELHNVGIMVDSSMGMHKLVQLVEALMGDPETPNRCRALAATYFDMDSAVNSYLSTYSALGAEVRKVVGN